MIQLPVDFKEFLRLLNDHEVRYLLVGGYAVGYYGYPRATGDMDIWLSSTKDNVARAIIALKAFGFDTPQLKAELFANPKKIIRMGLPPLRLELMTAIDGVVFEECYAARNKASISGIDVSIISKKHLIENKKASARHKDLNDVEHLS